MNGNGDITINSQVFAQGHAESKQDPSAALPVVASPQTAYEIVRAGAAKVREMKTTNLDAIRAESVRAEIMTFMKSFPAAATVEDLETSIFNCSSTTAYCGHSSRSTNPGGLKS